jgi:hypothetical protein
MALPSVRHFDTTILNHIYLFIDGGPTMMGDDGRRITPALNGKRKKSK